jgi:hypothetical protein
MRFMILIKADKSTEAGVLPDEKLLTEMGKFNEELVKAGVMLGMEGLHPSAKGARVKFSGEKRTVIDGPFTEAKELIAGFWLWQVKSKEEAIEWVKRCPNPTSVESVVEIRQVFEAEDFGAEFTPRAPGAGGAPTRAGRAAQQGREAVVAPEPTSWPSWLRTSRRSTASSR